MQGANEYRKGNAMQRRDAAEALRELGARMRWRGGGERLLDIGCGDGGVTVDVVAPRVPSTCRVAACDISEEMVKFAVDAYRHENIDFFVMDVEKEVETSVEDRYDHVVSFYTLHWIQDQQLALNNIHHILKNDGDCLFVFVARSPIFDVYRTMSRTSKWAAYMYDVDNFISPYHSSERPKDEFEALMREVGFAVADVEIREKHFYYDSIEMLKKAMTAVNPFYSRLQTDELREEFWHDSLELVRHMGLCENFNNNEGDITRVKSSYTLIYAYGCKVP